MKDINPLQIYLKKFKHLKRGTTKYGPAPHKPVLLLSVLQGFQNNFFPTNQISVTPELVFLFKSNWSALVNTSHVCTFALPFFHLKNEKFWHLIPKSGFEAFLSLKESISSLSELNGAVNHAVLDTELFELMRNKSNNKVLQQFILDEYFPDSKLGFNYSEANQYSMFQEIEEKILEEDPAAYRLEIKKLLEEKDEEEIFLRGSVFKREIPKIYGYACCISGMKVKTTTIVSMIDACHIIPFSISYDDTITNGIALCPNLHRAFDRGLISINEEFRVVISNSFSELETDYSIRKFDNRAIQLPDNKNYKPLIDNLEWHRKNIFKN